MKAKKENSFEKKVKIALAEKGETQASLARKMGITRAQINLWLKNKYTPKMSSLQKLADALDKPVNYFFENYGNVADNHSYLTVRESEFSSYELSVLKDKMDALEQSFKKDLEIFKKDIEILKLLVEKLAKEKKK